MNIRERFALYAPDWELSFNVRIATQTILSKVVKVVQVNNATDVRIARTVLLPSTTGLTAYGLYQRGNAQAGERPSKATCCHP